MAAVLLHMMNQAGAVDIRRSTYLTRMKAICKGKAFLRSKKEG